MRAVAVSRLRTLAALLAVAALVVAFLPLAGRVLVVADPLPASAEAIVVLAGSLRVRALEAARLHRDGLAPRIIVTREVLPPGTAALAVAGVELPESDALTRRALIGLGVPARAIVTLKRRAQSTASEARTIARWACRHGVRHLIVVTSPWHTRRARAILSRALGPEIALTVRPARADRFAAGGWMHVRRDAKTVLSEWEKLVHHWLVERWGIQRCGGLARHGASGRASAR